MPRMARSQSLPLARARGDDGRLVRSASPRRRLDDDDPDREDDAATAPAGRDEALRNQLKRINLSEKTLKMFEADEVDLQLLLDLDAESLAEVEFQAGERERLVEWLKAVRALKGRCAELDKAIP